MTTSNTPNIPDGVSFANLQNFLKKAPKGEPEVMLYGGKTKDQVVDLVAKKSEEILEECGDPMAHKAMLVAILTQMIAWHLNGADNAAMAGRLTEAGAWAADSGALNVALNAIRAVDCGKERDWDFLVNDNPFVDEDEKDTDEE